MRLGVLSDTHGNLINCSRAAELLRGLEIDVLLHCGDIGSPSVIHEFQEWSTHFVFGNVDGDHALLSMTIHDAGQTCHERFGELKLHDRKIAFLHSDDHRRWEDAIASEEYDLVCYGHTHRAETHTVGKTVVLNPGALHRANPHSFAVVELSTMAVSFQTLE